ncbi:UDP-N-acetylmuramoyl-tripeptide--D-alanyl-D-alanine ligase [Polaribacter reichenbachii]|uniref:UDP-N-acetylmuramoyl-tripeptide--D-alanyl-D-alanine ligase n=1 Tax=Polaribacter reichenbachii TaxID=996801 RepID=A0A1B8U3C9_9FLAO|nr:UDP-N-acetylmuramoyl-tripeptide--D-alanyl-D-alanine ligase [Polaribacter reichenbachii]APZ46560.1 UDP-N-acetylmuramoyl-tripeptide--D-alanyl-D-alanine ligase [Polaribacter reichenbachii]AUC17206.1 UDP-N-acetylmuramoyl-tripeptide--D-alanyl-D-alanine ligase [Polaribacter reichenbachii]OBY66384.1 UDP-N-acetylmuramoyl-tripeptide--D-alanyl-D-alanine ligase [Polaribacter reichenbachii]
MEISTLYQIYSEHFLVDTDTRNIRKNTIFFALKGDNFNGNQFAEKALNLGANYAIVDEKAFKTNKHIILVDDVLETLQKLANYHRKQLNIPVIGLTGSNGKTTTKELINTVLNRKYHTIATKGNLNNHIGVPLTLLSITPEHELAIVEMGANHQKEIEFLCTICEPDLGYITNFGKAHLEGFGSIEGVIKGKSELYTFLQENDKIVLVNPEDKIQVDKTKHIESIYFPAKELKFVDANPFVKLSYQNTIIQSNLIGAYNYSNIAAAITLGKYFKVYHSEIKEAIESYSPTNNRSQIINTKTNTIILDAYNANPTSMQVALENFAALKNKNKVIILGDMFELGDVSLKEHQAIVDVCLQFNFKNQFFIGENFHQATTQKQQFKNFEDFEIYLKNNPLENQSILIKGSRGMRLERVLDFV